MDAPEIRLSQEPQVRQPEGPRGAIRAGSGVEKSICSIIKNKSVLNHTGHCSEEWSVLQAPVFVLGFAMI